MTPPRKTQVSFRNDEYSRLVYGQNRKRRKSYSNHNSKSSTGKPSSERIYSGSSGANSLCRQADTGYEGSVSSVPSSAAVNNIKKNCKSFTSTSDISSPPSGIEIIQTVSHESQPERLSIVVSVDEQSNYPDNSCPDLSSSESGAIDSVNLAGIPELQPDPGGEKIENTNETVTYKNDYEYSQTDSGVSIKVSEHLSHTLTGSGSQSSLLKVTGLNNADDFDIKLNGLTAVA